MTNFDGVWNRGLQIGPGNPGIGIPAEAMQQPERSVARAWAEVDLRALRHNAALAKSYAGKEGKLMAIVKADAYGHGLSRVVSALKSEIDWFGVANAAEGMDVLRVAPDASVFVLGALLPEEREVAVNHGMVVSVSTPAEAQALQEIGRPVRVHLVIDTGMGRLGCLEKDAEALRRMIEGLSHLKLEGAATHLPSADEDEDFTVEQLRRMGSVVRDFGRLPEIHVSSSAGLLKFGKEQGYSTMHRPGLMLYGISPLPEFQDEVRPVMALKSRVTLVRSLPPGRSVSYGRTFVTNRETRVATVGIGYGDGYSRHLSNRGTQVLVAGKRCPLLGRVTMDQIMVDVTDASRVVNVGDEVVLFGEQEGERISASELAEKAGTIPWEILTGITRRVPRFYRE